MGLNAFGDRLGLQGSSMGIFWAIIAHFFFLLSVMYSRITSPIAKDLPNITITCE